MKSRALFATAALTLVLAACNNEPTGPECQPLTLTRTATAGDTVALNTGVRYIQTRAGTGGVVEYCRAVAVSYTGYLSNGTRFDSGQLAFTPGFQEVIPGFEQGIVGLKVGGARRIIIPPDLGYGNRQQGAIPPNSTLVFDVEVGAVQQ